MANQVDFKILPSDQFNVYSPQTRSEKVITYFTLLSKLRGDILAVSSQDDPNSIVSAYYTNVGNTQTLHLVKADGSEVTASNDYAGTVTSVGVSMPSAFTVTNSPITTSGTIQITGAGTTAQYVRGDGTLATFPSLTGFVPYVGATQNVDLGEYQIKAGQVAFDLTPTGTAGVGIMRWNDQDGTVDLGLLGGNVTLQVGQEQVVRVVNKSGINLTEAGYQAVKITGAQGNRLKVGLAQANNDANSTDTIGLVTENIALNEEGFITSSGLVRNIDTTGALQGETWADGDVIYLSPTTAGAVTKVKPTAPQHTVILGFVVRAHQTQGQIYVKVDNGYELEELHDVAPTPYVNNGVLYRDTATNLWKSATIPTVLGYTPVNSATTISTTAPLSGGGDLSANRTLSISQAGASSDGYLSSTDWNTFNSKEPALTKGNLTEATSAVLTITGGTGAVIGTGTTIQVAQSSSTTSGYLSSTDWNTFNGKAGSSFTTIAVAGQSNIVADSASDTLTIASGIGITLTTAALTDTLTITNSAPDQVVSLTGAGTTVVTGTYPTFTITSNDQYAGTVTSVAALTLGTTGTDLSSTVANSTTTPVITLNVPTASATNRGALSSADWTTFNSKQNAITLTTTGNSGSATFVSSTLNIPTYTLAGLGGVPTTRTITINGTAQDLSADRTWSVGTVTSISLTAGDRIEISGGPITSSGSITVTHGTATGADFTTAEAFRDRVIADGGIFEALGEVAIAIGSLEDAASPTSTDYSDGFVLQNIAVDGFGHVLGIGATDLDERYAQTAFKNVAVPSQGTIVADQIDDTLNIEAGYGITLSANTSTDTLTITNSAPDQVVAVTAGTGISVTGTYPNFTITNTSPSSGGTITGGGTTNYLSKWTGASALGDSLVFDNGTNVGIGTATPGAKLEVVSGSTPFIRTRFNASYYTDFDTNGIDFRGPAQTFDFKDNGSSVVRIASGGNVGIGTTTPAQKVQIGDGTATGSQYFRIFNSASDIYVGQSGGTIFGFSANSAGFVLSDNTSFPFGIGTTSAQPFVIGTTNAERMRITAGGNVGIGTTSPSELLDVNASSATTGYNDFVAFRQINGTGTHSRILFGQASTNNMFIEAANQDNIKGNLILQPYGGNVGIGTTAPFHNLSVAGKIGGATFSDSYVEFPSSGHTILKANNDVIVGYSQSFYVKQGGNVGIGTTAPTYKLQVIGGQFGTYLKGGDLGSGSDILRLVNASDETTTLFRGDGNVSIGSALPLLTNAGRGNLTINGSSDAILTLGIGSEWKSYYYTNSAGTYIASQGNRILDLETNGATRVRVSGDGNVGIGTTAPDKKLVVVGDGTGTAKIGIAGFSGNYTGISLNGTLSEGNYNILSSPTDPTLYINRPTGSGIQFRENNTSQMVIAVGGNVGIGTTAPGYKLDVNGVGNFSNGFSGPSSETGYRLKFYDNGGIHNDAGIGLDGTAGGGEVMWFNALGGFYFGLGTGGTKVTISNTGNVGIGTTSPTEKLHVDGNAVLTYNNSYQGINSIGNKAILARVSPTTGIINYAEYATATNLNGFVMGSTATQLKGIFATNKLEFTTNSSTRMTITSTGLVGIGTTSPSHILHITDVMRMDNVSAYSPNLAEVTPKFGYGDTENQRYLAEPTIWFKINVDGTEYVIPGYTEVI